MRAKRHAVLVDLISRGLVRSQDDARKLLAKKGFRTTQATVSRDLENISAVRVHDENGMRYTLQSNNSEFGASLQHVLREYVLTMQASHNMLVLRTPPGHASMVAAALDRAQLDGVLGTVAGDDTLFVCANEQLMGVGVMRVFKALSVG